MAPLDTQTAPAASNPKAEPLLTRGMASNTPALLTRADEVYMDFVSDARNLLMHAQGRNITKLGNAALAAAEQATGRRPNSIEAVKDVILEVPEVASYFRIKRSLQEAYWRRIEESYGTKAKEFEQALTDAESMGPGSITWDPNFVYPEYATVDIHIQPGGYTRKPLVGLTFDYGTKVFFGGANDGDALHGAIARKTDIPKDGKVERALEIGCSIGQFACGLKKRFNEAEVWGIDIGAPMVRYAHWRAVQEKLDVHFAQMPAEDMDFPDGHFDLVVSHLLFHETPVPVIRRILAETKRVLRPGGTFVMWDFASANNTGTGYGSFTGMLDGSDNGEPYAGDFVNCDVEGLMEDAGFVLRGRPIDATGLPARVGDKL